MGKKTKHIVKGDNFFSGTYLLFLNDKNEVVEFKAYNSSFEVLDALENTDTIYSDGSDYITINSKGEFKSSSGYNEDEIYIKEAGDEVLSDAYYTIVKKKDGTIDILQRQLYNFFDLFALLDDYLDELPPDYPQEEIDALVSLFTKMTELSNFKNPSISYNQKGYFITFGENIVYLGDHSN